MHFDDLQFESDPLPGPLGAFTIAYFRSMDEGTCTYCGGLGEVIENGADVACPVCRGEKLCIACAGDGSVTIGDEGAHRRELERRHERDLAEARAEVTGLPLKRALLTDQDVEALMGHVEAETLKDERGRNLLARARTRVKRAFEALDAERERRGAKGGSPGVGRRLPGTVGDRLRGTPCLIPVLREGSGGVVGKAPGQRPGRRSGSAEAVAPRGGGAPNSAHTVGAMSSRPGSRGVSSLQFERKIPAVCVTSLLQWSPDQAKVLVSKTSGGTPRSAVCHETR